MEKKIQLFDIHNFSFKSNFWNRINRFEERREDIS